ncbi:two pore calcium channel protein 2 isoform X1 [Carcharodon carcharias]|uniref:two pore calcium channel protein 2 isoform X1 n=1 Tax=Carcharodon carcharias TaxID=13397 RepID=UPI001B7D9858|nr:two pore calcium channel protein 2 isoform X1 [Carcharodon carcharias]XP_041054361.1 two pore calcium channel protein 2 isoform X1 [Carcharodon carcharias]
METDPLLGRRRSSWCNLGSGESRRSDSSGPRSSSSRNNSGSSSCTTQLDDLYIQQAAVFIEDAIQYRTINHRVDSRSLRLYRWYYSEACQWVLNTAIFVILALAFFEKPSSLSVTSDPRFRHVLWEPPCGLTEGIEATCLLLFIVDVVIKSYLIGWEEFQKSKWLIAYTLVLAASIVDWIVSLSLLCEEEIRVRRILRPFFLLQNSSLMKKAFKCLRQTIPQITSVMLLLVLHLLLFTMIAMLLFTRDQTEDDNEWKTYFRNFPESLTSLLVLLTTANNPDVMIPAYSRSRAYSLFFITFSLIGTYLLMNLVTAIIYNQFRGYLLSSIQTSVIRRCLGIRGAFEVLCCEHPTKAGRSDSFRVTVSTNTVLQVLLKVKMSSAHKQGIIKQAKAFTHDCVTAEQFRALFDELHKEVVKEYPPKPAYRSLFLQKLQTVFSHRFADYVGNLMVAVHLICIFVALVHDAETPISKRDGFFSGVVNGFFVLYYLLEMALKIFALGIKGYFSYKSNLFDGLLTLILLILQLSSLIQYGLPHPGWNPELHGLLSVWETVRLANILVVFRFLRIIPNIKLMALVASGLFDLIKNLRAFAGILVVAYYVFAIVGVVLFKDKIPAPQDSTNASLNASISLENKTLQCGTYEQLGYWPNNFNDFAAALVTLWDLMVVNNWQVFLDAFSRYVSPWSKLYFVAWWLVSSVIWVNLFVAFILENFIHKWDRSYHPSFSDQESEYQMSVQDMFRGDLEEPTEEDLLERLRQHPHLHLPKGPV